MDKNQICEVILAQRNVLYEFRTHTQLNRSDIEIMLLFNNDAVLNSYQVRTFFKNTNPQQTLRTLNKLEDMKILLRMPSGRKGKPKIYFLTENGNRLLKKYLNALYTRVNFTWCIPALDSYGSNKKASD